MKRVKNAHDGKVNCFQKSVEDEKIYSGGGDGIVYQWYYQNDLDSIKVVKTYKLIESEVISQNIII